MEKSYSLFEIIKQRGSHARIGLFVSDGQRSAGHKSAQSSCGRRALQFRDRYANSTAAVVGGRPAGSH